MSISPLIGQHLQELAHHPHIDDIAEIKPLVYKITYWPRDLESLYAEIPYTLKLTLPEAYPQKPPFITFLDKIHHLNIHPSSGQLSMSILSEDWSPFLNLKAVINSLDQVLQEPDECHAATSGLLQQYQTDITAYVDSVKEIIQKNIAKGTKERQQHTYTEEQVEEVIQVNDFSHYKINRPDSNYGSQQQEDQMKNSLVASNDGHIRVEETQKHDYSFNYQSNPTATNNSKKQQKSNQRLPDQQFLLKNDQNSSKPLQLKPPLLNNDSELNSPRQTSNNQNKLNSTNPKVNSQTTLNKYQNILKNSNNLLTYQNQHQRTFEALKQNMIRSKQIIAMFSEELNQMEENMEKTKSKRIKKLLQDKCNKLEQMIIQLFQISQKTRSKLMDMIRKGVNQSE